jgi:hypothetical protein
MWVNFTNQMTLKVKVILAHSVEGAILIHQYIALKLPYINYVAIFFVVLIIPEFNFWCTVSVIKLKNYDIN